MDSIELQRPAAMEKSRLGSTDSGIGLDYRYEETSTTFFDLPPEIRSYIYELAFDTEENRADAFARPGKTDCLHDDYYASDHLSALMTCRQFYADAHLLAFSRITFVVRNPYTALELRERMTTRLRSEQISAIRRIAFVAEQRHFRSMHHWRGHAFGMPALDLDELTIVLHRSSYWHYLFDFNVIVTSLLRVLVGVRRLTYVKNDALVKPHFHTWFNRLVKAMLRRDRHERFEKNCPEPERTWWAWQFDAGRQTSTLSALPAKRTDLGDEEYSAVMAPLWEELGRSIDAEEYDPDPMSRNGFV